MHINLYFNWYLVLTAIRTFCRRIERRNDGAQPEPSMSRTWKKTWVLRYTLVHKLLHTRHLSVGNISVTMPPIYNGGHFSLRVTQKTFNFNQE